MVPILKMPHLEKNWPFIDMLSSQVSSHNSVLMDFKFASIIKGNKSELKTGKEKENRLFGLFLCAQLIQLFDSVMNILILNIPIGYKVKVF